MPKIGIKRCRKFYKKKFKIADFNNTFGKNKSVYLQWLSIRNRNDVCSQWRTSLKIFSRDVKADRKIGYNLFKFDHKKKLGPNNFRWIDTTRRAHEIGITKAAMRARIEKCIEKNVNIIHAFKAQSGQRLPCCDLKFR